MQFAPLPTTTSPLTLAAAAAAATAESPPAQQRLRELFETPAAVRRRRVYAEARRRGVERLSWPGLVQLSTTDVDQLVAVSSMRTARPSPVNDVQSFTCEARATIYDTRRNICSVLTISQTDVEGQLVIHCTVSVPETEKIGERLCRRKQFRRFFVFVIMTYLCKQVSLSLCQPLDWVLSQWVHFTVYSLDFVLICVYFVLLVFILHICCVIVSTVGWI